MCFHCNCREDSKDTCNVKWIHHVVDIEYHESLGLIKSVYSHRRSVMSTLQGNKRRVKSGEKYMYELKLVISACKYVFEIQNIWYDYDDDTPLLSATVWRLAVALYFELGWCFLHQTPTISFAVNHEITSKYDMTGSSFISNLSVADKRPSLLRSHSTLAREELKGLEDDKTKLGQINKLLSELIHCHKVENAKA